MITPRAKREKKSFGARLGEHPFSALAAVCFVLLGVWYLLFLGPLLETIRADGAYSVAVAERQSRAKEQELAVATALVQQVQQLDADIKKKVAIAVPATPDVPGLLAMFDALVHQSGMEIVAVDVIPAKEVIRGLPGIGVQHIALNVHGGDYLAFRRLLVAIEHNLRILDVIAIAFNPQTASYTLTIRAYTLSKTLTQAAH
jgi:hypothetical protein